MTGITRSVVTNNYGPRHGTTIQFHPKGGHNHLAWLDKRRTVERWSCST